VLGTDHYGDEINTLLEPAEPKAKESPIGKVCEGTTLTILAAKARALMTENDPDVIRAGLAEIVDALDGDNVTIRGGQPRRVTPSGQSLQASPLSLTHPRAVAPWGCPGAPKGARTLTYTPHYTQCPIQPYMYVYAGVRGGPAYAPEPPWLRCEDRPLRDDRTATVGPPVSGAVQAAVLVPLK